MDAETQNQAANLSSKDEEPRKIIQDFNDDQKFIGQLLLSIKTQNGFAHRQATGTIVKKIEEKKYIVLTTSSTLTKLNAQKETVLAEIAGGQFFLRRTDKQAYAAMFTIIKKDGKCDEAIKVYQEFNKASETFQKEGQDLALIAVKFVAGDEANLPQEEEIPEFKAIEIEDCEGKDIYVSGWPKEILEVEEGDDGKKGMVP